MTVENAIAVEVRDAFQGVHHIIVDSAFVIVGAIYSKPLADLIREFIINEHPEIIEQCREDLKKHIEKEHKKP